MKKLEVNLNINTKKDAKRKMSAGELEMFLHFKRRGAVIPSKKGKGSYDRKKLKRELCNA